MSDNSTTVLEGYLERAMSGDVAARQRLLLNGKWEREKGTS